jgi:hypothetical protein
MKDLTDRALVGWRILLILLFFNMLVCPYSGRVGWMLSGQSRSVAVFTSTATSTENLKAAHSAINDEKSRKPKQLFPQGLHLDHTTSTMKKTTTMAMRARFTLIAAVSLAGCAIPDSQLAKHSTEDLKRRHAELTQRIKDDELGVYFGPIRWVSHAIEERGVTHENQAIEQELKRRPQNVAE